MGVPAFFRWLSRKYPSIVVNCVEEKPKVLKGVKIPVDSSKPNPNNYEFDNLYLDMNGIIHPCCHPEDKPAPKNEDEMMVLIFEYIDRIFSIVRPRKLLYMAIDGVAPRAKMNQQRSRRFRAAKEAVESSEEIARMRAELEAMGCYLPPSKPAGERFDSNCITPGTPFMSRLADCLRYYIHDRLNNDAGWQGIKVILSDANVPGEGEHKIMDYIRKQRGQPDHDPNTRHCLCGADADLIMLGLATHEPNFTIIREEFKPNKPRPCALCGQLGHEMKECQGLPKPKEGEFDELPVAVGEEQEFIFLRLNILREYLERELLMDGLPFPYDFERALDDWVFMCFFVGNDFLPHLPSLEIREGAIDRLVRLYKNTVRKTGGYLTNSGVVNLERVQLVMSDLGEVEDEIFKKRRETELDFRRRDKEKKKRMRRNNDKPRYIPGGQFAPKPLGRFGSPDAISNPRQQAYQMRTQGMHTSAVEKNLGKLDSAEALKAMMSSGGDPRGQKRGLDEDNEDEEEEPQDDVKLWEDGWKDRYYKSKFDVDNEDITFRHTVANHYVIGLCWVLRYYYQGCSSWKWYFPYHYAPFASDFVNIGGLPNDFEKGTKPFKPLEQLMGVFPAASKQHIPVTWQRLMCDPESSIIDFYPIDFKIDLNGKKFAWQGVALLPFVDEKRLLAALKSVYQDLTPEEKKRNEWGSDRLFVGANHPSHDFFEGLYEGKGTQEPVSFDCKLTQGMAGTVWCDEFVVLTGETVRSPLPTIPDLPNNTAISVQFKDPQYDPNYLFKAVVLKGAKIPPRTLKPEDFNKNNPGQYYRPQLGFTPGSGYREKDISAGLRMIRHNLGSEGEVPRGPSMNFRNQGYQSGAIVPQVFPFWREYCYMHTVLSRIMKLDQRAVNAQNRDTRFSSQSGNIGWSRNLQGQTGAYSRNQQQQGEQRGYNRGSNSGYTQGNMGSNQGYSQGSRGYGQGSNDQGSWVYGQGSRGYGQGSNDHGSRGYGQGSRGYGQGSNDQGSRGYGQGSRGCGQGGSNQSQQSYGQISSYNTAQGQRSSYSSGGTRDNRGYGNQSNSHGTEIPPPPFYKSNRR